MKIDNIVGTRLTFFKGRREDRNAANQLKTNNDYSLTENNKKRIEKAIANLANEPGEDNVKFLLEVADNLQYGTNIAVQSNWKNKLHSAVGKALSVSNPIVQEKYAPAVDRVFNAKKNLSADELDILKSKEVILSNLDRSQLKEVKNTNITSIERNLDYFIVSEDVPILQKKYILNRFEHLLSPDYHINPQLENKKTLVLAEMLNDIVVNSKSDIPNTKAINQKHHGMCAAISISRKLLSYEYKPDYVDSLLSELDDSPTMMVYDLTALGEKKKVPIAKIDVDFKEAQNKGYRIVDASTTQWMNASNMYGSTNKPEGIYIPFDAKNLGTFEDSHNRLPLNDPELQPRHLYYQTLLKANDKIKDAKISALKKNYEYNLAHNNSTSDMKLLQNLSDTLVLKLKKILPTLSGKELYEVNVKLHRLQVDTSLEKDRIKDNSKPYHYLPNEEESVKAQKIKAYLQFYYGDKLDSKYIEDGAKDIRDLTEMSKSIEKTLAPKKKLSNKIAADRKFFEAAVAYRAALVSSLKDSDLLTNAMISYNIVDSETLLLGNIAKVIKKLDDKKYLNHFAATFGVAPDKKIVETELLGLEEGINRYLIEYMDDNYKSIGLVGRTESLLKNVRVTKELIENGNKEELSNASIALKYKKPDKNRVVAEYAKFEEILENNPTEKQYVEVLNKMGYKNQFELFADAFDIVGEALADPEDSFNAAVIMQMNLVNGLAEDAPLEETRAKLHQVATNFNEMSHSLANIRTIFDMVDDDGTLINTANPAILVAQKMENEGKIISMKDLMPLHNRYNAIEKLRSSDEFSSRQGKISDPSLYKYTNHEKDVLKSIKRSINAMAANVNKELDYVYHNLREPLEDQARKIGINSGSYWVSAEGQSGLYSYQQTKILQQLTDKPYKEVKNIEEAIEIIKNTEHSGISSTSVFHDKPGLHAQYVAEITQENGKEVLFHDNTWGASEQENTWIDSKGVTRTDYSDNRGGELGYITNDKWRNGNYTQNLLEKMGKNIPSPINSRQINKLTASYLKEEWKFPLMGDIILPGVDLEVNSIVASIKDNIFRPDSIFIKDFEATAGKMSLSQIRAAKVKNETMRDLYNKEIRLIEKRLEVTPFNKGIPSKEAYDALLDNDVLKVAFEKIALEKSYYGISKWKELATVNDVEGVNKLKEQQKKEAKANFDYSFAKAPEILYAYALNKNKNTLIAILNKALDNNNIKLSDTQKVEIIKKIAMYSKEEKAQFDGSLKNTINFMVNKMLKQFDTVVPHSEAAELAKVEIKEKLTKDISAALYFNNQDLLKDTEHNIVIKKYIDNKYNPATDEEFVEIYKNLQDMTLKEFKEETSDVKDADMGYKNYSGYEMLKKYNAFNESIESAFNNVVYQKYLVKAIDLSETIPSFKYKKLEKKLQGVIYDKTRKYDDLYLDFRSSLEMLTYDKAFNKNKDRFYRQNGVMPAYPKINVLNKQSIDTKMKFVTDLVGDTIDGVVSKKANLYAYLMTDKVDKFLSKIPNNSALNKKQRDLLNGILGEFITVNYNDKNIQTSVNAASKMIELGNNVSVEEYKKIFSLWKNEVDSIKILNPILDIQESIKSDIEKLKTNVNMAIRIDFPIKYRSVMRENMRNWIREEMKNSVPAIDKMFEISKVENKINKYALVNTTEKQKSEFLNNLELGVQIIRKTKKRVEDKKASKEVLDAQFAQFDTMVNAFLQSSIQPEYQKSIKSNIEEYVNTKVKDSKKMKYSDEKSYLLHEKIVEDYQKYHVLNHPIEILDRFLELSATDGEIASAAEGQQKMELEQERQLNKQYLESALSLASLVDMQSMLMDAASIGNAALVTKKFKNYDVPIFDEKTDVQLTMADDLAIDNMVRALVLKNDDSVASMFIEKLGLTEEFLKVEDNLFNVEAVKKNIRKIANILSTTNRQSQVIDAEVDKYNESIGDGIDTVRKIDELKKSIIDKTKKMSRQKNIQAVLSGLDGVKEIIKGNPEFAANENLVPTLMQEIFSIITKETNEDIAELQDELSNITTIYNLINKLDISETAPAYCFKQSIEKKYDEVLEYNRVKLAAAAANAGNIIVE